MFHRPQPISQETQQVWCGVKTNLSGERRETEAQSRSRQLRPAQRQREGVERLHGLASIAHALTDGLAMLVECCDRENLQQTASIGDVDIVLAADAGNDRCVLAGPTALRPICHGLRVPTLIFFRGNPFTVAAGAADTSAALNGFRYLVLSGRGMSVNV